MTREHPVLNRMITRRALLGGVAGSLLLVACSDDDDEPADGIGVSSPTPAGQATQASETPTPAAGEELRLIPLAPEELGAPSIPPATVSTAAEADPLAAAIARYEGLGTSAAPGSFPRTIVHAMGETTLDALPQRIVCLDTGEMDTMVGLNLKPVGVIDWTGTGSPPPYLEADLGAVDMVGTIREPDLEAIAALGPDLILSNRIRHEAIYEQLSAIAPTVMGHAPGNVWRQNFKLYAQTLGREVEAAEAVLVYEERVRALNESLPDPRPTVSVIRVTGETLRYYQRSNFLGTVLTDLGFPRPEAQNVDDFALLNQSLETLGEAGDGDVIVLSVVGGESDFSKAMLESPLWQSLPAVQNNRLLIVDDNIWIAGLGYQAAGLIFDDISEFFAV